ncbi:MAG TPA: Tad domain-containing protein, partial [Stellaceae bacterium]|nr:Tad domain-containing protein [Stellaceae bacterium]
MMTMKADRRTRRNWRALGPDREGATAIVVGLALTGVIGFAGLGTEVGLWYYTHRNMQDAADSGALGAATALWAGNVNDFAGEARAAAARYGFADGTGGVTVTVNNPPLSGNYAGNANAVEVIIQQPQPRLFSAAFIGAAPTITARAVALDNAPGKGCVLALDTGANASTFGNGTTDVVLTGCQLAVNSNSSSALTLVGGAEVHADSANIVGGISGASSLYTVHGVRTHSTPVADPYQDVAVPPFSGCNHTNFSAPKNGPPLTPGVYCNGISINGGANVQLSPGVYIVDRGSFFVAGNATVTGSDVTVVLTSSTGAPPATADIHGGATLNMTAPATGPTAGLAFFQDRNGIPGTVNDFSGGTTQNIIGALYFPKETITFAGGTDTGTGTGCTQLIADEIDFKGNANIALNCSGRGTKTIGGSPAK